MKKAELIALFRDRKDSEKIDLSGKNLEGLKSNLLNIEKNEILYKPGSPVKSFFFVVSGEIMVSENDNVDVFKEKEYFGYDEIEKTPKRRGKAIGVNSSMIMEFLVYDIPKVKPPISNPIATSKTYTRESSVKSIEDISLERDHSADFSTSLYEGIAVVFVNLTKAILTHSKPFLEFINKEIEAGNRKFIIDLRKCTIIDSTFLGSLVKSLRALTKDNGKIVLVYNKESQSTLFMITYMDKVFETFDTVEQAVEHLNK